MKRLMTGISQDDQTSYRRLKENIEVILFLKIKKDLSEMLRIYEVDNGMDKIRYLNFKPQKFQKQHYKHCLDQTKKLWNITT